MTKRMNISRKLIIIYLIVGIPLTVVIALTYRAWYLAEIRSVLVDRTELARLTGTSFSLLINDMENTMGAVGDATVDNDYTPEQTTEALAGVLENYPVSNVVFTNGRGRVVAATDDRLIGTDLSDHPSFSALINQDKTSAVEPSEKVRGEPGFHVTQAVRRNDRLEGIVGSFVDVRKLHNALPVRIGEGGANIVDSSGRLVFQSEFPDVSDDLPYWGDIPVVRQALQGDVATSSNIEFPIGRVRRMGAEVPIEEIGWTAGSFVGFDLAIGPVRESVLAAMIASVVIGLLALVTSILIARAIVRSLGELVTKARVVGEGRFDEPVIVGTGDEVEDVAKSLDETRLNLKKYVEGLSSVAEAGRLLTSSLELEEIKKAIVASVRRIVEAEAVWILLNNEKTGRLEMFMWAGPGSEEFSKVSFAPGEGVAGKVFASGQPAVILDVQASPEFALKDRLQKYGLRSAVELPLYVADKPVGVLGVFSPQAIQAAPGRREMEFLTVLASQIAISLENARLFNTVVANARRQEAAVEIGKVLNSTRALNSLLETALHELTGAVKAQTGSFYIYDSKTDRIKGQLGYGIETDVIKSIEEPIDIFAGLRDCLFQDKPLVVSRETASGPGKRYMEEYGIASTLILPLVSRETPIGLAFISKTREPSEFEHDDVEFAMLIARQAAVAVENARLFDEIERAASAEHTRREELEAVINSMEDGVAVVDTDGRISMVNPFGSEIVQTSGLGEFAPGGRPEALDLSYPEGNPVKPEDIPSSRALEGERVSGFELVMGARKGRSRILSVSAAPYHDRQGRIAGAAIIFRDVTERRRAEQDLQRRNRELQILSEVSGTLARTLDLKQLIEQVAEKIALMLEADVVYLYLLDEERMALRLSTSRGLSDEFVRELGEIKIGEKLTGISAQTGLPIAVEDIESDPRTAHSRLLKEGLASFASVPIKSRGKVIGVMPIATRYKRRFSDRDMALLSAIGNLIGTAIENAQLYETEKDIAETLQESLLGSAPVIEGFDIGVVYEPAFELAQVGGDFFDFIEFADGKIAALIGDVSGKGLKAATLTAMAKNTVRAFAYEDAAPSHVLSRANEVIAAETGPTEFVTLLFVLLDIPNKTLRIGSAGHPPPFLCDGHCLIFTGEQGLPLGAFHHAEYSDITVDLAPEQSLIMFTDGLTDARTDGMLFGDSGIGRTAAEYKALDAQELAERLVKAARDFAGGKLPDDVAVIVLKMR
ncbi:MAG: GAF domain-containing protein [Candidatus Aquicultorales bacterium]